MESENNSQVWHESGQSRTSYLDFSLVSVRKKRKTIVPKVINLICQILGIRPQNVVIAKCGIKVLYNDYVVSE